MSKRKSMELLWAIMLFFPNPALTHGANGEKKEEASKVLLVPFNFYSRGDG